MIFFFQVHCISVDLSGDYDLVEKAVKEVRYDILYNRPTNSIIDFWFSYVLEHVLTSRTWQSMACSTNITVGLELFQL